MGRNMLRRFAWGSLIVLFIAALATQASAQAIPINCGDTSGPGGTNVNCSCGDTVTTNTNLSNSDPVTQAACTGDGLFVNAGVRLTVNNRTLQGSGTGSGVTLLGDSARVISGTGAGGVPNPNSTIQGFAIGVSGTANSLQVLSLNVRNNLNEGIKIVGNLNTISNNKVFLNGINGGSAIDVSGDRNTVTLNSVGDGLLGGNDGDGIVVVGTSNPILPPGVTVNNLIAQNTVLDSLGDAIVVSGNRNTIQDNQVGDINHGNVGGIVVENSSNPPLPLGVVNNSIIGNNIFDNDGNGIDIAGDQNVIAGNRAGELGKGNGANGIFVEGNRNKIGDTNAVWANSLNGIVVAGNENTIQKNNIGDKGKGNGGDGLQVVGAKNRLSENKVFANLNDGIEVSGGTSTGPNLLLKNSVGDRGKGNGENGIYIHDDSGSGVSDPVELDSNVLKSNGRNGILIAGAGHELKKNSSGGSGDQANGRCAFSVAAGNFNATGNSANGVGVSGANGTPFPSDIPTGCVP